MKTLSGLCAALLFFLPDASRAQVNSGSNGSDGALNPIANLVINMADHPDGIYHYTSVNIPAGVTVSFIPNAGNKPVVWLVQNTCVIEGNVDVSGTNGDVGGIGGVGGYRGGNGGTVTTAGLGPGGGQPVDCASYGSAGHHHSPTESPVYGSKYILPLLGGSGGGGGGSFQGGGGGGAFLVASPSMSLNGSILANGGSGGINGWYNSSGGGSGGAVRIISSTFSGHGSISANGGSFFWICGYGCYQSGSGGNGRIRIDCLDMQFSGGLSGTTSQGFQPIILPAAGQGIQLSIASIAGNAVPANPSGVLVNPDVIIPAQQTNPIPIVVGCNNIPLNTEIYVFVHPANGPDVQAVGINNAGTLAASTATVSLNMPRGGGIIYAKCVSGLAGLGADTLSKELRTKSLAETGWTTDGERLAKVEVTAALGGQPQIAYISESGKRYPISN
jgi:hypothetical protein